MARICVAASAWASPWITDGLLGTLPLYVKLNMKSAVPKAQHRFASNGRPGFVNSCSYVNHEAGSFCVSIDGSGSPWILASKPRSR